MVGFKPHGGCVVVSLGKVIRHNFLRLTAQLVVEMRCASSIGNFAAGHMTQRHVSLPVFHFYQKFLQSG